MNKKPASYSELPLVLSAPQLADTLGISRSAAYALLHRSDFPTLRIGKRLLMPRDKLLVWLDIHSDVS